jgi:hypothetical protein
LYLLPLLVSCSRTAAFNAFILGRTELRLASRPRKYAPDAALALPHALRYYRYCRWCAVVGALAAWR